MARPVLGGAVTAALVVSACGSSATTPSATTTGAPAGTIPRVPPRDRFIGMLGDGAGALAGARDMVEARLQAGRTTGTRRLTLWIVSTSCRADSVCVHLRGRLRGHLVPARALPDIGRRYAIAAVGSLYPLGAVTAAGTVAGTGNVVFGSELLRLALSAQRGSARLSARSARVPGFTSP